MAKNKMIANFTGVSAFIILSKMLGFLRDILIAASIGTSKLADAFLQIFGIPSLLFTSIGIALSSVNIPNLTYYISEKSYEERKGYVSNLFRQISLFASLLSVLGIVLAPWVVKLILPGVDKDAADIAVKLTRIMFPALLFVCLAYITSGILQVHRHFFLTAVVSIPSNIIIIATLLIWHEDVVVLGYVTTLGWLVQFLIQVPMLNKEKYDFRSRMDVRNEHTSNIYRQLVPILLGNAVLQLCFITDRSFATHLGEGAASALSYGGNLFVTITSVFIVAMSTVTFPDLSKYCLERNYLKIRELLSYIFKVLLLVLIPYLVIVAFYSNEIISLVYRRGAFTDSSVMKTSTAFLLYSFCIAGYVSQEIYNRVFYALKIYMVPMLASLTGVLLNLLTVLIFYKRLGIIGIAGSTAFSFAVYTIVMSFMVGRNIGTFLKREFVMYVLRLLIPTACMMAVFMTFKYSGFEGIFASFLGPLLLGGSLYLGLAYYVGVLKETIFRRV